MSIKKHILIVGGGFAGTKTALELSKHKNVRVTLISDQDHFRYYRSLYRVATGRKLAGSQVHLPDMLRESEVTFVHGKAAYLDRVYKKLKTEDGQMFDYDFLVLALGTISNYFGLPGIAEYSYSIKSTEEAERLRKHLHQHLVEHGCLDTNYTVIGGGPAGIELAGALPGYLQQITKRHGLCANKSRVILIEAAPRLMPQAPESVSSLLAKRLRTMDVTIMLDTIVQGQTANNLFTNKGHLASKSVVWTAGMANNPFFADNSFVLTERGKVAVNMHLQAEPDIFVLGDNADTPFSGLARTALRDGRFAARNIIRNLKNLPMKTYNPKKPTSIIPVGPKWASVQRGKMHITGYRGWALRHLADLLDLGSLQPWSRASTQWVRSVTNETISCPGCVGTVLKR